MSVYNNLHYARAENVKASSTLLAADEIVEALMALDILESDLPANRQRYAHEWAYLAHNETKDIDKVSRILAEERGFPVRMADVNHGITDAVWKNMATADI